MIGWGSIQGHESRVWWSGLPLPDSAPDVESPMEFVKQEVIVADSVKPSLAERPEILLIEDDLQIRKLLRAMLTAEDRFLEAIANLQVLPRPRANPTSFSWILGLPDKDGVNVVRGTSSWSQMPILIISVTDRGTGQDRALDAGADDYVTKPFRPGEVSALIRAAPRRSTVLARRIALPYPWFSVTSLWFSRPVVLSKAQKRHLTPTQAEITILLRRFESVISLPLLVQSPLPVRTFGRKQKMTA